jgi:hypothetical protein
VNESNNLRNLKWRTTTLDAEAFCESPVVHNLDDLPYFKRLLWRLPNVRQSGALLAGIGKLNFERGLTAIRMVISSGVLLFAFQHKNPRRDVARMLDGEMEAFQTQIGLLVRFSCGEFQSSDRSCNGFYRECLATAEKGFPRNSEIVADSSS